MGDDLKHPRVDEINFACEQQIGRDYKFTATCIKRDWKNFINSWTPTRRVVALRVHEPADRTSR